MAYSEHSNLENLRETKKRVTLFITNGFQLTGVILGHDEKTVLIRADGVDQMVYKSAISTIKS